MNRRIFLMAGSSAALAQTPSEKLNLGLIGAGGRGRRVMTHFKENSAVRVAAVCDIYEPNLERGLSAADPGTKAYRDYKELLADKAIDIVLIASPEHWHHQMVLDALAAGKDVYVEKPLCHTPEEGVELIRAEKASDRIVQVGMQRRSYNLYNEARELREAGKLGKVRMVRTYWLNNRLLPPTRQFEGRLDWEQWVGPAPKAAKDPQRFFDWRNYSDYSGGIVIDQGAHIYDSIHMIMGAGYPTAVNASACPGHKPNADLPESWIVIAEYPEDFMAVFTINYSAMRYEARADQLNAYDGDLARMDIGREFLRVYPKDDPNNPIINKDQPGGFAQATIDHVNNFLECVRTRNKPNAPVELGFQSALVLQMANISVKQGRRVKWNREQMKVEV
jgi:predicted dehydrogenase